MLDDTIIPEERYMPSNKQPICLSNIENGNSSEEYEPWGDRKVNSCKEEEMTDESDEELGDDDEETDSDVLATANAWFSTIQRLAKKNESIAALYERVSKSSADLQES